LGKEAQRAKPAILFYYSQLGASMPYDEKGLFVLPNDDEMDDETADIAHRAAAMRQHNADFANEMAQVGIEGDFASARADQFAIELVRLNVLTVRQYWEIELNLQKKFREAIKPMLKLARERRAQMEEYAKQQRAAAARQGLAVPQHVADGNKIWTPHQGG
jgi:hypothetical protein